MVGEPLREFGGCPARGTTQGLRRTERSQQSGTDVRIGFVEHAVEIGIATSYCRQHRGIEAQDRYGSTRAPPGQLVDHDVNQLAPVARGRFELDE
jgi:hypothetical protein